MDPLAHPAASREGATRVELRDALRVVRKGWILIISGVLAGLAAAAIISLVATPKYQATTALFVSVQTAEDASAGDLVQGSSFAQQKVRSYVLVATSPRVLEPVIDELKLNRTAASLARDVSVSSPANTVVIEITVHDVDPSKSAIIANAVAESFIAVVEELESPVGGGSSVIQMQPIQPATVPTSAYTPNSPLNLALGLLVGLAVGLGAAVIRSVLDTRIHGQHDIEALTDRPVIGGIALDPAARKRPLVVQAEPRSPRAESYRTVRTNLQFVQIDGGPRVHVVTSSLPSEGKTTTVANLAIAIAESGMSVVVIDGDLRRPRIAEVFGLEGAAGLTDVLVGRVALVDVVQRWGQGALAVLPAGRIPPNPSELLGSRAMATVLDELSSTFDVVLIDAPPLLPVTDAAVLSRLAGGAIVIAAAGRTRRTAFEAALRSLDAIGSRVHGVILTMLPVKGPDAYGYSGYEAYGAPVQSIDLEPPAESQPAR